MGYRWYKKNFFLVLFLFGWGTSLMGQQRNFFQETWKPKFFACPDSAIQKDWNSGVVDANVNVDIHDSLYPILPVQLGVNTTFRSGASMATKRIPLYQESGWGVYRFPAGSGSNTYFWDGKLPDSTKVDFTPIDGSLSRYLTPAGFAAFKKAVNGEATIVVNYFYARYGITSEGTREARVLQAAKYAAGFVRKMNVELGAHVKYWEIGNECYGSWETGYTVDGVPVTGKEYGEDFRVFVREMKKVDSTIKIGAVVYSKDGDWNRQVLAEVKDDADFLVVHNYFTNFSHTSYQDILSALPQVSSIKKMLDDLTESVAGKPRGYFPVAMTEYNNRGDLTTTMANAIFVAQVIGELMKNDYGMATLWVGEWKWAPGTHGVIAVADPDQPDYSPRQAYMDFRYYRSYFGDYLINATSDNDSVKIYASRFSDGKIGLCLINESSKQQNIKLNIQGITQTAEQDSAWWYAVYADNIHITNKKFYINGQTGTTPGGGPEDFAKVKPYFTVWQPDRLFPAHAYSVNFVVLSVKEQTTSVPDNSEQQEKIHIFPNPFKNRIVLESQSRIFSIKITGLTGKTLLYCTPYAYRYSLNTTSLKPGIYILKVKTQKGNRIQKIIKW
ncbi:T9SS type A sorting domain-containing protein [Candidatus Sulfidibacterium hydrothermale]|uniref:T9SS type A sorting domain-containing protein n=1 Tax=Candidatus Sulfidibacterium hydrothermale TaxID=2875962 RepID=UPI001F0B43C5|nr:T9SS type A sorting domain-containing protein [Candidatus Sulfidibacterium hydrothermale]UBM61460.1 T9SS type A sorting domain-containing protein [Candidatus Sulfidibacterium hydrothermale]